MDRQVSDDQLDRLATAIEQRFPDLRPARPLNVLGSGFRSLVVETPSGVAIKIGKSPDAAGDYAKEWRIGQFLADRVPGMLPEPRWRAEPCGELPYGALGYVKLAGETPLWGGNPGTAFARDLGAFMALLHAIPVDDARDAGVPEIDAYRRALGARDVVMPVLVARLDGGTRERVEAWWIAFAADLRMPTPRVGVCHHDLWHDNLLRSESGRLSGVLDIAHVEIGDPAHDFSAPRYFGDEFMTDLIGSYRAAGGKFDVNDEYRSRRFLEAREFGGLAWAIEHDDPGEVDESLTKIIRGPIVAGS